MHCHKMGIFYLFVFLFSTNAHAIPTFYTNMEHLSSQRTATQHHAYEEENSKVSSEQFTLRGGQNTFLKQLSSGGAGSGFSSVAGGMGGGLMGVLKKTPFAKMIPNLAGATGCGEVKSPAAAKECFYAKVDGDFESTTKVRQNISVAQNEATDKMLSDATTILNDVSEFEKKKKEQQNDLNKSQNTSEIQMKRIQTALNTNQLFATNLSLSVSTLEVLALQSFQSINFSNINNPNNTISTAGGLLGGGGAGGAIGSAVGGIFKWK